MQAFRGISLKSLALRYQKQALTDCISIAY
jgi:hypothetical protein